MAFFTSWKLSILALTVVPPITFACKLYARWGQKITRAIYQALGDSNMVATETIGNVRTVRAFSTEIFETQRYAEGVQAALKSGIRSAYVGASVTAFSSYMNLGTSVLILWYGGELGMSSHGTQMSIGNLITFQLFFC